MECCDVYESVLGTIWITGRDGVLTGLSFAAPAGNDTQGDFPAVKRWLDDYFQGILREIDFPMAPAGTPFQQLVWKLLLDIPFGRTCTYGQLAKQAAVLTGKEKMSPQAVGQAVGRNPIAVIIPCHRVIGGGGRLTGYAWGLERKRWLLAHEQNQQEDTP